MGDNVAFLRSKGLKNLFLAKQEQAFPKHLTHKHSHNDATDYTCIPTMLMRSKQKFSELIKNLPIT